MSVVYPVRNFTNIAITKYSSLKNF